jgi:pyruvate ferredoxin oxidoreductase beta subunit
MNAPIKDWPVFEYVLPGSAACAGCPSSIGLRIVGKALGENAMMVMTPSCAVASTGLLPHSCYNIPALNVCFATAGAAAGGLSLALDAQYQKGRLAGEKPTVFTWVGDGGAYDIGLQGLSAAAERNDDFICFCYNNEAYSNTGMQRSGATPLYAATTTTPLGKGAPKKNLPLIMLEHNIPYIATASLAYPADLYRKAEKAKSIRGFKYIEIHAPCGPGWKFASQDTIEIARLAARSGAWLLWEAENSQITVNTPTAQLAEGSREPLPLLDYIGKQGRFAHIMKRPDKDALIGEMQADIRRDIQRLSALAGILPPVG